jgi:hypothetical protein
MSNVIAQKSMAEIRFAVSGKPKAAVAWDDRMATSEKKIILMGANLDQSLAVKEWERLTSIQKKEIYEATYRLSRWASKLGLVTQFEEVVA